MKKLILAFVLTASVWSSFSFASSIAVYVSRFSSEGSTYNACSTTNVCYQTFYVPSTENNEEKQVAYLFELTQINRSGLPCTHDVGKFFTCEGASGRFYLSVTASNSTAEPSNTCTLQEGGFIDGYHSTVDDFCALIGETGGNASEPLFCIATNLSEIPAGSGNFQHTITTQSCSEATGPVSPEPCTENCNPDPEPCTENCEPTDPETPPTGNDGSGIPTTGGGANSGAVTVTGTQTDSQGNVTTINMTMEQDFSPLTERINETNQRLQAENQNSSTIIDQLNELIQGNAANGQILDTIANNIGGSGTDTTAMEGKLDGIKESIDGIKDGFGTEQNGIDSANNVDLPDYGIAINDGFNQINDAMNTGAFKEHTDTLEGITGELTAFDSIPELFLYASQNCTPIPFGSHFLNTCQYAPTISAVLTWASYLLVVIFLFTSISATLTRIRLS